jgi:hypothetical protein
MKVYTIRTAEGVVEGVRIMGNAAELESAFDLALKHADAGDASRVDGATELAVRALAALAGKHDRMGELMLRALGAPRPFAASTKAERSTTRGPFCTNCGAPAPFGPGATSEGLRAVDRANAALDEGRGELDWPRWCGKLGAHLEIVLTALGHREPREEPAPEEPDAA